MALAFFRTVNSAHYPTSFADTLVVSGTIYTADDANTQVEAVVIEDGRFTFVGDLATAQSKAGEDHRHIALALPPPIPVSLKATGISVVLAKRLPTSTSMA